MARHARTGKFARKNLTLIRSKAAKSRWCKVNTTDHNYAQSDSTQLADQIPADVCVDLGVEPIGAELEVETHDVFTSGNYSVSCKLFICFDDTVGLY